jgi:hypothetical protein
MQADEPPVLDRIGAAHDHMEGDIALSATVLVDQEPRRGWSQRHCHAIEVVLVLKLLVLIHTAMETSDGQVVRRLSFKSWLDESAAPVGSSSHGFSTPTINPYMPTTVSLSFLSFFVSSLHIEQLV